MVTPSSFPASSVYSSARARKAPIHNPFDKFTQTEFDAWISDITGALRRALGEEPTPTHPVVTTPGRDTDAEVSPDRFDRDHDLEHSAESASDIGSDESQDVEDSFAGVRARHAKGKERDPREGPGLGSQQHPIDIESEEDEEEEDAEERIVEELEGDEELEEEEYEEDEQEIPPFPDEREEEEDQGSDGQEYEEDVLEEEDDGEGSDIVEMTPKPTHSDHVEEIIDLVSDGDPDDEDAFSGEEGPAYGPMNAPDDGHFENLFSGDEQDDRDHGSFTSFRASSPYFWRRDPLDFPASVEDSFSQPPDILDPWEGPTTYAEDFYAGGDLRDRDLKSERPSPSNLTPVRQERVETLRTFIPG
jgi:hypothetical protein